MQVLFRKMCDRCHRMLGDEELTYSLKIIDDENVIKIYKGHKDCMDELATVLCELYGTREKMNDGYK